MRVFDPRGNTDIAVTLKIFVAQLERRGGGGKGVAPESSIIDNAHEREIEARYLELFDRV